MRPSSIYISQAKIRAEAAEGKVLIMSLYAFAALGGSSCSASAVAPVAILVAWYCFQHPPQDRWPRHPQAHHHPHLNQQLHWQRQIFKYSFISCANIVSGIGRECTHRSRCQSVLSVVFILAPALGWLKEYGWLDAWSVCLVRLVLLDLFVVT
jgi:hypothetical protein